ncbi:MAG: hypothetical protein PHC99_00720 [Methylococcales bacterium]|nr:hypothetical protein [Methylococcales bacterium]
MAEHMSPAGQKKYLTSQKLEAVVRDKEGNIVAKLYKNGMSMNLGYDGGTTPEQKLKKLENAPNVTVTYYDGDVSDFDLIPEEVALAERDYLKRPELYPPELLRELRAINEQRLALFHGNLKATPKSFVINDVLTAHDKKLVDAATPKTVTELKAVNELAAHIAIDRETGSLSGEVDENYINKLIAEQSSNNHAETIKFSALQKSLAFLQQERADFFNRVKPDFTNMTPNEFGELTKSGRYPELPPLVLPKGWDPTKDFTQQQLETFQNTKVNYIELVQKQIDFNKSIGESTEYFEKQLNLMKNFAA